MKKETDLFNSLQLVFKAAEAAEDGEQVEFPGLDGTYPVEEVISPPDPFTTNDKLGDDNLIAECIENNATMLDSDGVLVDYAGERAGEGEGEGGNLLPVGEASTDHMLHGKDILSKAKEVPLVKDTQESVVGPIELAKKPTIETQSTTVSIDDIPVANTLVLNEVWSSAIDSTAQTCISPSYSPMDKNVPNIDSVATEVIEPEVVCHETLINTKELLLDENCVVANKVCSPPHTLAPASSVDKEIIGEENETTSLARQPQLQSTGVVNDISDVYLEKVGQEVKSCQPISEVNDTIQSDGLAIEESPPQLQSYWDISQSPVITNSYHTATIPQLDQPQPLAIKTPPEPLEDAVDLEEKKENLDTGAQEDIKIEKSTTVLETDENFNNAEGSSSPLRSGVNIAQPQTADVATKDARENDDIAITRSLRSLRSWSSRRTRSDIHQEKTSDQPKGKEKRAENSTGSDKGGDDVKRDDVSSDDDTKLYCICRRPHENRFMVMCDRCGDWFHGSCVKINKAMAVAAGQWFCPNCKDKPMENLVIPSSTPITDTLQPQPSRDTTPIKSSLSLVQSIATPSLSSTSERIDDPPLKETPGATIKHIDQSQDVVKETKFQSPIDQPVQDHSLSNPQLEPLGVDKDKEILLNKPLVEGSINQNTLIGRGETQPEHPIGEESYDIKETPMDDLQAEKSTPLDTDTSTTIGLDGPSVSYTTTPTETESVSLPPVDNVSTLERKTSIPGPISVSGKERRQSESGFKSDDSANSGSRVEKHLQRTSGDDIRATVRRQLVDSLTARLEEDHEVDRNIDVAAMADDIEKALFSHFGTTPKYKHKHRALLFNLRDKKNAMFYKKVLNNEIDPQTIVTMTHAEMASKELHSWLLKQKRKSMDQVILKEGGVLIRKTHKGEEVVDLNKMAVDYELPFMSSPTFKQSPLSSDPFVPITSPANNTIDFDSNLSTPNPEPDEEDKEDSPLEHLKSPDYAAMEITANDDSLYLPMKNPEYLGVLSMQNLDKVSVKGECIVGDAKNIDSLVPYMLQLRGRIPHAQVVDYVERVTEGSTRRRVSVVRLQPLTDEDEIPYISMLSYFSGRRRCGVVGNCLLSVTDCYIVPIGRGESYPSYMNKYELPARTEEDDDVLLVVLIHTDPEATTPNTNKRKSIGSIPHDVRQPKRPRTPLDTTPPASTTPHSALPRRSPPPCYTPPHPITPSVPVTIDQSFKCNPLPDYLDKIPPSISNKPLHDLHPIPNPAINHNPPLQYPSEQSRSLEPAMPSPAEYRSTLPPSNKHRDWARERAIDYGEGEYQVQRKDSYEESRMYRGKARGKYQHVLEESYSPITEFRRERSPLDPRDYAPNNDKYGRPWKNIPEYLPQDYAPPDYRGPPMAGRYEGPYHPRPIERHDSRGNYDDYIPPHYVNEREREREVERDRYGYADRMRDIPVERKRGRERGLEEGGRKRYSNQ
eukprot:Ihof_evm4s227 gene=Ihof_evmTU4s227